MQFISMQFFSTISQCFFDVKVASVPQKGKSTNSFTALSRFVVVPIKTARAVENVNSPPVKEGSLAVMRWNLRKVTTAPAWELPFFVLDSY